MHIDELRMIAARFVFYFDTQQEAKLIVDSLLPETHQKIPKIHITISQLKNQVLLTIKSPDVSSLRAACNSYLRWMQTAVSVHQVV